MRLARAAAPKFVVLLAGIVKEGFPISNFRLILLLIATPGRFGGATGVPARSIGIFVLLWKLRKWQRLVREKRRLIPLKNVVPTFGLATSYQPLATSCYRPIHMSPLVVAQRNIHEYAACGSVKA